MCRYEFGKKFYDVPPHMAALILQAPNAKPAYALPPFWEFRRQANELTTRK